MKLGILVNTDRHLDHFLGIAGAALDKGHEVTVFVMDGGTALLHGQAFLALAQRDGVSVNLCEHSAGSLGVKTEGLPESIVSGSQLNNAMMNREADKVIVF